MKAVVEKLAEVIPNLFDGDSHAYLISIYKDPAQPMMSRIDAAKAAIKYERPALSSIEHSGGFDVGISKLAGEQLDEAIQRTAAEASITLAATGEGKAG